MPDVVYVGPQGHIWKVAAQAGSSLMETALSNGVPGIVGQCGGSMTCASCHVYVDSAWIEVTGRASDLEEEMLEGAVSPTRPESRLSCQIAASDELAGVTVHVPPEQL